MKTSIRIVIILASLLLIGFCVFTSLTATGAYPAAFMLLMIGAELFAIGAIVWASLSY